jgi:hypothetical protein
MALFACLSVPGFGYGAVIGEDFVFGASGFVMKLIAELGLASVISLPAFCAS